MLKTLYIKNFILIDELLLEFENGFNVLLGETGAGKSIIIKAIDVVFGAKTSKDVLKDASQHALIEVCFENDGVETVISREISPTGTKCRLNGALVLLDAIKEEREKLIDIHSQFQAYSYMQQKFHIELLDLYIESKENGFRELLDIQKKDFKEWQNASLALEKAKNQSDYNTDRIDYLKYQIDEIEKAEIEENEEESLNAEFEILSNAEELKELSYNAYWTLLGEDCSIVDTLRKISSDISRIKDCDNKLAYLDENFCNALEIIKDTGSSLRNYSESLSLDSNRLEFVNERLALIQKLKRKYGNISETYDKLTKELKELEDNSISTSKLEEKIGTLLNSMNKNSEILSSKREKYAKELSGIIELELNKLEFENPKFEIKVEKSSLNQKGHDDVEFLITTNIAKPLAPMVKVASGGEISRIILAIKTVFAAKDNISTVIFDEIDTGISGKTSIAVGDEILKLSYCLQVFAITHQPIIASKASSCYWVSKTQSENDTKVKVTKLDEAGKIKALAQLSSGVVDETSINFAKELVS